LRPELPGPDGTIKDSPEGKIDKLDNNRTLIRKYPETFLYLVGLSHSFTDIDARPTLLRPEKSEVALLTEAADMVVNPSAQSLRLVTHKIADEIREHSDKNKGKVGVSAVPPPVKKARTGGNDYEDEFISNHDDNVRSCPPPGRYFVLSSSSAETDIIYSQVVPPVPSVVAVEPANEAYGLSVPRAEVRRLFVLENETGTSAAPDQGSPVDDFYESQTIDSATAKNIYVPNWEVTNNARMDDPIMCRNLVDYVPLPCYWASLYNLSVTDFLDRVNLNSAQHVCMVSELCLRYEHEITVREKFEKKFTDSSKVIQQKDAEIVELRSKFEKAEDSSSTTFPFRLSQMDSKPETCPDNSAF
nr:hypothetical protein [Tanacetum cinerariifolium]